MRDTRFTTLSLGVLTWAALVLGVGCRAEQPATEEPVQTDLGSTAADACRAPDEPGCNPCCIPQSNGTCRVLSWDGDTSRPDSGVDPWFNVQSNQESCPGECRACARCTERHELELQQLGQRPECDCTQPIGADPCFSGGCECYCYRLKELTQHCPDLVPGP